MALVSKNFSDIVTFTRASTALAYNASGVLTSYAINAPRLDYDPVTLLPRGLLIEEQRTNLFLRSEEFDAANWSKVTASVSANAVNAPDGNLSADMLVEDASTAGHYVTQGGGTATSGTAYTLSVFAKAGTRSAIQLIVTAIGPAGANCIAGFDLSAGTASSAVNGTSAIQAVGNGWYRCSLSITASLSVGFSNQIRLATSSSSASPASYAGDGVSGAYLWGAQLEAGAFATSYIPTTSAQVTRSADVATINTLSPWFNAVEGTIYIEATGVQNNGALFSSDDGTTSNRIITFVNGTTTPTLRVVSGGADQANFGGGSITSLSTFKFAGAYKANDFGASVNGGVEATDTSGSVPSGQTTIRIGSNVAGSTVMNAWLRKIIYYPQRKPTQPLTA